jgi:hypothetical protein
MQSTQHILKLVYFCFILFVNVAGFSADNPYGQRQSGDKRQFSK